MAAIACAGESQFSEPMAAIDFLTPANPWQPWTFPICSTKKSQNSFVEDCVAIDARKPMAAIACAGESQFWSAWQP